MDQSLARRLWGAQEPTRSFKSQFGRGLEMRFCSHNLKIGIFADKSFLNVENNVLSGPLSVLYNQLFLSKVPGWVKSSESLEVVLSDRKITHPNHPSSPRNCTIRVLPALSERSSTGESERNSTWFNLWRNKVLDMAFWKGKLQPTDDLLERNRVIGHSRQGSFEFSIERLPIKTLHSNS